jgi:hypothetical protein
MAYQVPKADHPWRQYANRKRLTVDVDIEVTGIIPVREFVQDLDKNWDKIEVTLPQEYEGRHRAFLKELPQVKVAAWIAGMLKRYYVYKEV